MKLTTETQAEFLVNRLTCSGFREVKATRRETLLKKGQISFVIRRDGSVFSIAPRTGKEKQLLLAAA